MCRGCIEWKNMGDQQLFFDVREQIVVAAKGMKKVEETLLKMKEQAVNQKDKKNLSKMQKKFMRNRRDFNELEREILNS